MIAADTNILIRYLVRDDLAQYERASAALEALKARGEAIWVGMIVAVELAWTLVTRYGYSRIEIVQAMSDMLDAREFEFESEYLVAEALHVYRSSNVDFADVLISLSASANGCVGALSFDKKMIGAGLAKAPV